MTNRSTKSSADLTQKVAKLEADSKSGLAEIAKLTKKLEDMESKSLFLGTTPPGEQDRPWLHTDNGHVYAYDPMRSSWLSISTEMIYASTLELKDTRRISFALNSGHPVPYNAMIVGMSIAAVKMNVNDMKSLMGAKPVKANGDVQIQFYIDESKQCYNVSLRAGVSTDMTLKIPVSAGAIINSVSITPVGDSADANEKWSMNRAVFYVKWIGTSKNSAESWIKSGCTSEEEERKAQDLSKIKTAEATASNAKQEEQNTENQQ